MENPQHFECDTPDCCYWSEDGCTKRFLLYFAGCHIILLILILPCFSRPRCVV